MCGFAVIRKDEGFDHLSLLTGDGDGDGINGLGFSVVEDVALPLPFILDRDENLLGGSCGEWSYMLYSVKGHILLMNSKDVRVLPPPSGFNFPTWMMHSIGMGYVAQSQQYKVIRRYSQTHYLDNGEEENYWYDGSSTIDEVCILGDPSCLPEWQAIEGPDIDCILRGGAAVYLAMTGRCYWAAFYNHNNSEYKRAKEVAASGTSPDSQFDFVMSFDFATDSFDRFSLPATDLGAQPLYKLVECRDSIGVLAHDRIAPSTPYGLSIQLHRWSFEQKSWGLLYRVGPFIHVAEPSGLKNSRFMFLESIPSHSGFSQLLVYDLEKNTEVKLNIYDSPTFMLGFSYAESLGTPLSRKRSRGEEEEAMSKPHSQQH